MTLSLRVVVRRRLLFPFDEHSKFAFVLNASFFKADTYNIPVTLLDVVLMVISCSSSTISESCVDGSVFTFDKHSTLMSACSITLKLPTAFTPLTSMEGELCSENKVN